MILGAKRQVLAMFGDDRDEAQTRELVRKSERSAWAVPVCGCTGGRGA